MFIAEETARAIVSEMKSVTGRDINLMDGSGTILASTDPHRVGQRHAGAEQLLRTGQDKLVVRQDDSSAGTRRGVNLPIHMDGQTVGVIGITGPPEQVEPLGSVIKRMTEILLREAAGRSRRRCWRAPASASSRPGCSPIMQTRATWNCGAGCWGSTPPRPGPW